jgi:uncharacterized protein (DUF2141 family)
MSLISPNQQRFARNLALGALFVASTFANAAFAGDLTIHIKGVGDKGNVMIALYKKSDTWMRMPTGGSQMVPAKGDSVTFVFKDLLEGEYAATAFVDENSNGKLDSNAIGIPTEPFAFSNDAAGTFGPPTFEQAKFMMDQANKSLVINAK